MLSRFRLSLLVIAIAGLALAPVGTRAAPAPQDSAKGRVDNGFTKVDFDATSTPAGFNASGSFRATFTSADPNQVYEGDVTCLSVVGATATTPAMASIGGVITKAPPGSGATSFTLFASDSGKFAADPDTFTWFFSSGPPPPDGGCPAPIVGSPVTKGEVVIQNALP